MLAYGRDLNESPKARKQRVFLQSMAEPSKALRKKLKAATTPDEINAVKWDMARELQAFYTAAEDAGLDIKNIDVNNTDDVVAAIRIKAPFVANREDMFYEYWINSILSGPGTHVANLTGAMHGFYDQLFVETLAAAGRGEVDQQRWVLKGMRKSMANAMDNAIKSFAHERNVFENDLTGESRDTLDINKQPGAIPGKAGKIIRTPTRVIAAMDAYLQTVFYNGALGQEAYQAGKAKNLKGQELADFISQYVESGQNMPNEAAFKKSRDYMFKDKEALHESPLLGGLVKSIEHAKDQDNAFGTVARFMFPFTSTPGNLLRIGVSQYSPLGALNMGLRYRRGLKGEGEWAYEFTDGKLSPRAVRQVQHDLAGQAVVWMTSMALLSLIAGDEDGEPFITGAGAPYTASGEKGHELRNYPPMSIRLPGTDQWFSYRRLDPIATGLAAMVDAGWGLRRAKNGQELDKNWKQYRKAVVGQLKEKTYLRPIGDLLKAMDNPDSFGQSMMINYGSSFMPSVVRVSAASTDDYIRDFKKTSDSTLLGRVASRALPVGSLRPNPKRDPWGRPIEKPQFGTGPTEFLRLFSPMAQVDASTATNLDRLITNWNVNNPNDQYYVPIPRTYFTHRGKRYDLTEQGYDDIQRISGEYITRWWKRQEELGRINYLSPKARDIKVLNRIVNKARDRARMSILRRKDSNLYQ
jgi:hypothetical protein